MAVSKSNFCRCRKLRQRLRVGILTAIVEALNESSFDGTGIASGTRKQARSTLIAISLIVVWLDIS